MKKIIFSLAVLFSTIAKPTQFEIIRKFNTIVQSISQELSAQAVSNLCRSSGTQTKESYALQLKEKLEQEVQIITDNKKQDELTQEEQDLIKMLEMYICQLQMFYPGQ